MLSDDPVTRSMFHSTDQQPPDEPVNNIPDTPAIDISDLSKYPTEALRQVNVDLKIKQSRINKEIAEIDKLILRLQKERYLMKTRLDFYVSVVELINSHFGEQDQCHKTTNISQPDKSSVQ